MFRNVKVFNIIFLLSLFIMLITAFSLVVFTSSSINQFLYNQNIENLKYILSHYQIDYASIKRIEDEREFLSSITDPRVRVIFNPRIADNGKLRFMQVL